MFIFCIILKCLGYSNNVEYTSTVFQVIKREPPRSVSKDPPYGTLYSDYDKVKILIEHGGIYLDMDVLAIRPMDDLRKYSCTVGLENALKVCSGVIVCSKDHPFLYLWLDNYYDEFDPYKDLWAFHSGRVPSVLIKRYSNLIHIESDKFHKPNFRELEYICGNKNYRWKDNYTLHTWIRLWPYNCPFPTEESIKTMNSTYGQIARQVYYGTE